jgi:hypothetical protein
MFVGLSIMELEKRGLVETWTKLLMGKNQIMFAELSIMESEQMVWFDKKQAIIC